MTNRKLIVRAFIASLLVHVLLGALTWNVSFLGSGRASPARAAESVELVLADEPPPAAAKVAVPPATAERAPAGTERTLPNQYTEIPERMRAAEAPERADFLAMFNARAADRQPGGDKQGPPAADRAGDFAQVTVSREELGGVAGVQRTEPPATTGQRALPQSRQEAQAAAEAEAARRRGGDRSLPVPGGELRRWQEEQAAREATRAQASREEAEADWDGPASVPSLLSDQRGDAVGDRGFDFDQLAQGDLTGGTTIDGDFSLNTYEWNFAPWMHRFVQDLHRNWIAPYAYGLGVIHGVTRIRLVVEPDGHPSAMDILEVEGHASLHQASLAALKTFAPYAPLPPNFPEDRLEIILSLHYPQWK